MRIHYYKQFFTGPMIEHAMVQDFSWERSAWRYLELYRSGLE